MILLLLMILSATPVWAREPQCPGGTAPDVNVFWCDDFEDGTWLDTWDSGSGGGVKLAGKEAVVCGNRGATDNCTATDKDETLGWDGFGWSGYYGESRSPVAFGQNYYWRFYFRVSNPFRYGNIGSKIVKNRNINAGNCINVSNCINLTFVITDNHKLIMDNANGANAQPPGVNYGTLNQNFPSSANSLTIVEGHWYLIEYHVQMNTPGVGNGVYEQWLDDVTLNPGVTKATQTKRSYWYTVDYRYSNITNNNIQFGAYWQDTSHTIGVGPYPGQHQDWDNIVISRARIGPATAGVVKPELSPPTGARVQ